MNSGYYKAIELATTVQQRGMTMKAMKADLHVHSKFSRRPSYWILQRLGAAESYVEPEKIYGVARREGMTFVTISDHNSIDGSLEIAHLPGAFVSEEVTTYFPDNGCKIHVLVLNITASQHRDIQKVRSNIFELAHYLNDQAITHVVAHPLFAINDRLTVAHFEKLLLLFSNFELNGTRDGYQNAILQDILGNLDAEKIQRLADRHDLAPVGNTPWCKNLTGGSDDHSGNHIASMHTVVDGKGSIEDFLSGIDNGRSRAEGRTYNPKTMAHTFYSIAYQYYKSRFSLQRLKDSDPFFAFFDNLLGGPEDNGSKSVYSFSDSGRKDGGDGWGQSSVFSNVCVQTARDVLMNDIRYKQMAEGEVCEIDERVSQCHRFVNQASDAVITRIAAKVLSKLSNGNIFDIFTMLGTGGALYTLLAPYFIAYKVFTKDRCFCRFTREKLRPGGTASESLKVGHFTDTLLDVNGVAKTLRMQADIAAKKNKALTMITCGPQSLQSGMKTLTPIGAFDLPEYPELKLYFPSLLSMIDYCYEEEFSRIHIATPGPVGLAALATARILQLTTYGTYHTALPQYVMQLTGDSSLEDLMWKFMIWFYNQMDVVFVPSRTTGRELAGRGIKPEKIRFYPRGVDTVGFTPSKRNGFYKRRFQIEDSARKLLYVGRVSKEKNVDLLVPVCKEIFNRHPDVNLVIVGSGPYLDAMKTALSDFPVIFTGFLEGEDLKEAYASSDVFVFPSTTDTFGNVVLEAQASGIPVVVTDQGGPQENLIPDKTGFVVPGGDADALVEKIDLLLKDGDRLNRMKRNARQYMEGRSFDTAFGELWEMYREPVTVDKPAEPFLSFGMN